MTPDRRAALMLIRQALTATQVTLDAFARLDEDYSRESYLNSAAVYIANAIEEIQKAEAVQ